MNQLFFENGMKTQQDKRRRSLFPVWVLFDPACIAHDGQFETLGHTGGSLDQEIIDGEHQQQ